MEQNSREKEEKRLKALKQIASIALKMSGEDVVAPPGFIEENSESFFISEKAKDIYLNSLIELTKLSPEECPGVLRALTMSTLRLSAAMHFRVYESEDLSKFLKYLQDHPEYKEKPSPEDLMNSYLEE